MALPNPDFQAMMKKFEGENDPYSKVKPGEQKFAKIVTLSNSYAELLAGEIMLYPVPDEIKVWAKGEDHYAMLIYHGDVVQGEQIFHGIVGE